MLRTNVVYQWLVFGLFRTKDWVLWFVVMGFRRLIFGDHVRGVRYKCARRHAERLTLICIGIAFVSSELVLLVLTRVVLCETRGIRVTS